MADDVHVARWLSVGEASRALGMSRTTLLAAEETGLITAVRTPGGHRRYPLTEIERYLRRAGLGPSAVGTAPTPIPPSLPAVALAEAARAALRPFVRALDGDCAGVYRFAEGRLRFCAGFGIPRWLTERLADAAAPAELTRALTAASPRVFDAAAAAFPEPRATGTVLALPLGPAERRLGVLFLLAGRDLLAGELRVAEACAELVGALLAERCRICELEVRLDRISELSGPG